MRTEIWYFYWPTKSNDRNIYNQFFVGHSANEETENEPKYVHYITDRKWKKQNKNAIKKIIKYERMRIEKTGEKKSTHSIIIYIFLILLF